MSKKTTFNHIGLLIIGLLTISHLHAWNDSLPLEPFAVDKFFFQGNNSFKSRVLKQALGIKEKEAVYNLEIEKATRNLISFYVQQGFQYVNIGTSFQKTAKGVAIVFNINEGPRITISQIDINWINPSRLFGTIDNHRVKETNKLAISDTKINLHLNRKLHTDTHPISNQSSDMAKSAKANILRAQLKVKIGDFLIIDNVRASREALIEWYQNNGYAFVDADYQIDIDSIWAKVSFLIDEGPLTVIEEIKVRGNQKVRHPIIVRTTQIKTGEKYSRKKLRNALQCLYATRLFERVSFSILQLDTLHLTYPRSDLFFSDKNIKSVERKTQKLIDSITIRFDVLEQPVRSIGLGVGLQTPPFRLMLSTEWEHLNFLSRGQNLFFLLGYAPTFSSDWRAELKSMYRIFYFLNLPINFSFQPSFKYEKRHINNSDLSVSNAVNLLEESNLNLEAGISRYFGQNLELGTYLRYLRIWTSPVIYRQSITNSQNLYIRYDTRDNLFTPQRGIFFSSNFQLAGSILEGDNDFYKTQTELILFKSLLGNYVMGFRIMSGFAVPYGRSQQIPFYDAFNLGGNNGLRGFNEKALGPDSVGREHYGTGIINTNWEFRSHYQKLLDWVFFSDLGRVDHQKDIMTLAWEEFFYSIGFGIRINTKIGPIRIDYAKRLKAAPNRDWGKIHLGLLNLF